VVTGASGLLGRQVVSALAALPSVAPLGLCHSRPGPGLVALDLTDHQATARLLREERPQFVIHAAAQRFPDKVEADPAGAAALNVEVTRHLAGLCRELGARLIYISTDYVFDGSEAPYSHDHPPSPANRYGETKLAGEEAAMEVAPDTLVLRIPVLYGPVRELRESAITVLLETVRSGKPATVSSYEVRCPAHTSDVASILADMVTLAPTLAPGVYQWSGLEKVSKWDVVRWISSEFGLSMAHLTEQAGPSGGTPRPRDVELVRERLEAAGISHHRELRAGLVEVLRGHL